MSERTAAERPARERGHLDIRPVVVERLARLSAIEVDGVLSTRTGMLSRHELPDVRSRVTNGRTRVSVDLAVAWGHPLAAVTVAVQQRLTDRVHEFTGLVVDAVDVTVEQVVVPRDDTQGRVR